MGTYIAPGFMEPPVSKHTHRNIHTIYMYRQADNEMNDGDENFSKQVGSSPTEKGAHIETQDEPSYSYVNVIDTSPWTNVTSDFLTT